MKYIFIITLALWSQFTFSHGENKLGPNGGYIKMPGAFHTEIVPISANGLNVYLLDMSWKNPSILDSSLTLSYNGAKSAQATCTPKKDHYHCQFDPTVDLKLKGSLNLLARRENKQGNPVTYELPLTLLQTQKDDHESHH